MPRAFYERSPLIVARALLGRVLVWDAGRRRRAGRILEVEAYRGARDPASHAYRGLTARTRTMFGPPGHAYVYFTYGMHHCLNVVCEREGRAGAVLLRALEPLEGLAQMARCRGLSDERRLLRGPGCIAQAFELDRSHDGLDLVRGPLWIADDPPRRAGRRIVAGPRIGIRVATELPWRFHLEGHALVSGSGRYRSTAPERVAPGR